MTSCSSAGHSNLFLLDLNLSNLTIFISNYLAKYFDCLPFSSSFLTMGNLPSLFCPTDEPPDQCIGQDALYLPRLGAPSGVLPSAEGRCLTNDLPHGSSTQPFDPSSTKSTKAPSRVPVQRTRQEAQQLLSSKAHFPFYLQAHQLSAQAPSLQAEHH